MLLIILGIAIFVVWFYVLFVREWLVALWPGRFTRIREWEKWLWDNSRTILTARLYWLGGAILAVHEWAAAAGFDFTPIVQQITDLVPDTYQKFVPLGFSLLIMATGFIFERLRKTTTEPLELKTQVVPSDSATNGG